MDNGTGILIATGALFAMLLMKHKTGSVIVDPIDVGDFPLNPNWDHFPDAETVSIQPVVNSGSVNQDSNGSIIQPGAIPVLIDFIGIFPVSYATVSGARRSRINLGRLKCV